MSADCRDSSQNECDMMLVVTSNESKTERNIRMWMHIMHVRHVIVHSSKELKEVGLTPELKLHVTVYHLQ